ncbi:hypothetical protein [Basfia succiniciproducens]|uniref:Uncharacterized protein n=1 Tax=Basfia succiniciproducens TaxID=653940 RepID=A0A1G5AAS5_9PAST|nr:hypothetical protein [Basfia succiniciproducens]QIM68424.1 hypothetical protein A4G13_02980 [Basfia succiniciproducens]SCX74956.1 hypothetical protein SAMN02910354_00068 [Basfia succiniciproducens]
MKSSYPFSNTWEKLLIGFFCTPIILGILLFINEVTGFQLVCISLIGTICLWGVFITVKMLQINTQQSHQCRFKEF